MFWLFLILYGLPQFFSEYELPTQGSTAPGYLSYTGVMTQRLPKDIPPLTGEFGGALCLIGCCTSAVWMGLCRHGLCMPDGTILLRPTSNNCVLVSHRHPHVQQQRWQGSSHRPLLPAWLGLPGDRPQLQLTSQLPLYQWCVFTT